MAFAPGSVDLLAWTEDRGHVGIADLRTGFISRQILDLDNRDNYDHITISDRSAIDPRLLLLAAARSDDNEASASASLPPRWRSTDLIDVLGAMGRRHRSNREHWDPLDAPPFAPNELEVLDAIRDSNNSGGGGTATERRTNTSIWRDNPSARSGGIGGSGDTQRSSGSSEQSSRERGSGSLRNPRDPVSSYREYADVVTGVPRRAPTSLRASASTGTRPATVADSTRTERERQLQASIQALREASDEATGADYLRLIGHIARFGTRDPPPRVGGGGSGTSGSGTNSNSQTQTASDAAAERRALNLSSRIMANPSLLSPTSRNATTTSASTTATATNTNTNPSITTGSALNATSMQQLYYNLGLENTIPFESFNRILPEIDPSTRRLRHASLREWDDHPTRRAFGALYMSRREPDPHDTAGLCWSENGRVL